MDYFITGGSGFIGQNLTSHLALKNAEFKIADINCIPATDAYCIDVTVRLPLIKGGTIVHLASETNVRKSIEYPKLVINKNTAGLLNCIDLLQRSKFERLIFTSAASSALSSSPYLASKAACESICKAYTNSFGLDIQVLKLSNVYGPYSTHKESIVATLIKKCIDNEVITIYGDGKQSRDFVHVDDVVEAIYKGKSGYITSGKLLSINALVGKISDISSVLINYKPRIVYENAILGEVIIPNTRSDIFAKVDIDKGLTSTFMWFIENYKSTSLKSQI
jgi:UDP-glucose 4-epimerase